MAPFDKTVLIEAIHASPFRVGIAVTGGGAELTGRLFAKPGASRAMVAAAVPYEAGQLERYLNRGLRKAVCSETAEALAIRGREEARLTGADRPPLGFGASAALSTTRERRGEEQAFLCVATDLDFLHLHLRFEKGARSRAEQEAVLTRAGLMALAAVCAGQDFDATPLQGLVAAEVNRAPAGEPLDRLERAECRWITIDADGRQHVEGELGVKGLLPGSFNPLHQGHLGMAEAASRMMGGPVAFELSLCNADKQPIPVAEVRRRLRAMHWRRSLVVTRAATFVEKARLFPGMAWILGHDTAERVVHPKYYGSEGKRDEVFAEFARLGARFLVMGRSEAGLFRTLDHVAVPANARHLFSAVPETEFRVDVSSTEIRRRAAVGSARPPD